MGNVITLVRTAPGIAIKLTVYQVPNKLIRYVAIVRLHAVKQEGAALTVLVDRRQSISALNPSVVVFAHFLSPLYGFKSTTGNTSTSGRGVL